MSFSLLDLSLIHICIRVKGEELKAYGEKLSIRIQELEQLIYEKAGEEFNINSPKQLGVILFEKMGIPGGRKTKTGYSTAADILEKLAPEQPIVSDILEYRQLTKLKSTYACLLYTSITRNSDHIQSYGADTGHCFQLLQRKCSQVYCVDHSLIFTDRNKRTA